MVHLNQTELEAGVHEVRAAPADGGTLDLIVRRPAPGERDVLDTGELDLAVGLVGDNWQERPSKRMPGKDRPHPDMQLNIMNSRAITLIAGTIEHWPIAGDQLYVDLDLSEKNLSPGTRLTIGNAMIEITAEPHAGCAKFAARFGTDAARFVNSDVGKELKLRGINAKVVRAGRISVGDVLTKHPR